MGGAGSRSYASDPANRGQGRKPKAAIGVCGTGIPEMPNGLSKDVKAAWNQLIELTSGVTFSQDSIAILEAARLMARQEWFAVALEEDPLNDDLNRLSLAVGRQLNMILGQLGLTPRARQSLLIPKKDEPEKKSRLQELRDRQAGRDGT